MRYYAIVQNDGVNRDLTRLSIYSRSFLGKYILSLLQRLVFDRIYHKKDHQDDRNDKNSFVELSVDPVVILSKKGVMTEVDDHQDSKKVVDKRESEDPDHLQSRDIHHYVQNNLGQVTV